MNEMVLLASEPASFPLSMRLIRSPKSSDVEKLRLMKSCTSVIRDGRSSMKLATWRAMSAPMAPTKSSDTRRIPNRKTAVATPRRQPRRARKLTPGSMANDRNSEMARRNSSVCRRENSHRPTSVAMKPSQNTTTARRTHRGMGAAPSAGSIQGRSEASASSGRGSTGGRVATGRA